MSDIVTLISTEGSAAVDQIIEDSGRLHTIVNGTGTQSATTEDGSLIPSVRKAILENFYFKTPVIAWSAGTSVTVFNQLYSFTSGGATTWWYAPGATASAPVVQQASPMNDTRFRLYLDGSAFESLYAPINSPLFTGNPRVPTPATNDDSGTIANTAWVQDNLDVLREEISALQTGEFTDLAVTGNTELNTLHTSGNVDIDGDIDASGSEMSLNKLHMAGEDATIDFTSPGTPPAGITTQSSITGYTISTGDLDADEATFDSLTVTGPLAAETVATDLQGLVEADYVHITGNSENTTDRPQLIVDGIAQFGSIVVTGGIQGIDFTGQDIHANSLTTDEGVNVGTDLDVVGNADLHGTTTVNNLVITGDVTGLDLDVDGLDIHPRSVTTDQGVTVGTTLNVTGASTLATVNATGITVSGTSSLGDVEAGQVTADSLLVSETINSPRVTAGFIDLQPLTLTGTSLPATYQIDLTRNMINMTLDKNVTLSNIDTTGFGAFTLMVYLRQDATGGRTVTLDTNFTVLNPDIVQNTAANAISVMQMAYSGISGDPIDVIMLNRP